MLMTIFLKTDTGKVKKGVENFYLSSGTNKSISNFCETIPLMVNHGTGKSDQLNILPDFFPFLRDNGIITLFSAVPVRL
jgi:hypothetical protein